MLGTHRHIRTRHSQGHALASNMQMSATSVGGADIVPCMKEVYMKQKAIGVNRAPGVGLTPGIMETARGLEPHLLGFAGPAVCHVT